MVTPTKISCLNIMFDRHLVDVDIKRNPLFVEGSDWPPLGYKKGVCCWHCCHPFDSAPVPYCMEYDPKRGVFSVFGVFCTFACAKAYVIEKTAFSSGELLMLLEFMARKCFGCSSITVAPPRHRLTMFGGDLAIEQFRSVEHHNHTTVAGKIATVPESYEKLSIREKSLQAMAPFKAAGPSLRPSPEIPGCMFNEFVSNRKTASTTTFHQKISGGGGSLSAFIKK